ncbi:hypothetical protein ES705_34071 [subsurface metagenome]
MKKSFCFLFVLILLISIISFIGCEDAGGGDDDVLGLNQIRVSYEDEIILIDLNSIISSSTDIAIGEFSEDEFEIEIFSDFEIGLAYELELGEYDMELEYSSDTVDVETEIDEELNNDPGIYTYSADLVTYYYNGIGVYVTSEDPHTENITTVTFEFNIDPSIFIITDGTLLSSITFADSNLEACVTDSGKTYVEELLELDCESLSISNLSGIENLTYLMDLRLGYNNITDISELQYLTFLRELTLNSNPINSLEPIKDLPNLGHLDLGASVGSDISALENLISLHTLLLHANGISDITSLSNLTNLSFLYLDWNNITDVSSLATLINLEEGLWLQSNDIQTGLTDLSTLIYTEGIYLYNNTNIPSGDVATLQAALPDCDVSIIETSPWD